MSKDKTTRTVSISKKNDKFLSSTDNASALVDDLLEQYRQSGDKQSVAIDLQLRQKRREKREKQNSLERVDNEIKELEQLKQEFAVEETAQLEEVKKELSDTPREVTNPAIQAKADQLDMTPTELVQELPDKDSNTIR